jgi:hypothetical protein
MPISSLENLKSICVLPNKLWYHVYIHRYMASKNRCSFCHRVAVFTEGELTRTRGLKFCFDCYHEQVMTSEEVEQILRASLSNEHYQQLRDMDITLRPSWKSGEFDYYLKWDVAYFVNLVGGEMPKKSYSWRDELESLLLAKGLSKTKAAHYAYHIFPEDGSTLEEVANQILRQENPEIYAEEERKRAERESMEKANENERQLQLENALKSLNIDKNSPAVRPYFGLMQQFIKGKGGSVDEIVYYITSSMQRQQSVIDALDRVAHCPHPPKNPLAK